MSDAPRTPAAPCPVAHHRWVARWRSNCSWSVRLSRSCRRSSQSCRRRTTSWWQTAPNRRRRLSRSCRRPSASDAWRSWGARRRGGS
eukprot:6496311-Prymnesium_polylepis.1